MESFSGIFLQFIADWGYVAVAVLMAAENACIPIPSELILGFAGFLIFSGDMTFMGALTAGMIGGIEALSLPMPWGIREGAASWINMASISS